MSPPSTSPPPPTAQAFQRELSSLKLQRSRAQQQAGDVAAALEAAQRAQRRAQQYDEYAETVGQWQQQAGGREGHAAADGSGGQKQIKVVLITGFESFNVELYKQVNRVSCGCMAQHIIATLFMK